MFHHSFVAQYEILPSNQTLLFLFVILLSATWRPSQHSLRFHHISQDFFSLIKYGAAFVHFSVNFSFRYQRWESLWQIELIFFGIKNSHPISCWQWMLCIKQDSRDSLYPKGQLHCDTHPGHDLTFNNYNLKGRQQNFIDNRDSFIHSWKTISHH